MKSIVNLGLVLLLALVASTSQAAVVNFKGVLASGGGGTAALGTVFPREFALSVVYNEQTPFSNFGTITGGSFLALGPNFPLTVTGGTIIVTEGGAADTGLFLVDVGGAATGQIVFTFSANAITNSNANAANIAALVLNNQTTVGIDLGNPVGGGVYSGTISDVPEPGTCAALIGLVCGGAWRMRRRKISTVA